MSVHFDSYNDDTISLVLESRARDEFDPDAVNEDMLARIACLSEGDASRAIAACMASREGLSTIPARFVKDDVANAEQEVRQKTISKLNAHQFALYEILSEEGGLIQKELYAWYERHHDNSVTFRYLRENHHGKCGTQERARRRQERMPEDV